jgi:hypothetical protein
VVLAGGVDLGGQSIGQRTHPQKSSLWRTRLR